MRMTNSGAGAGKFGLLVGGLGVGALLMYLFDPDRGRGRRARLNDQLSSKANHLVDRTGAKARDLRNRAQGVVHQLGLIKPKENIPTDSL
jgi:hypothetical protein